MGRRKNFRAWRYAAVVFVALALTLEVIQLLYPAGKLLPFVMVEGQKVGGMSIKDASATLEKRYSNATLTVKTDTKEFDTTLDAAGIGVDIQSAVENAATYPSWQRIIP
ncbi:MAG TPA: hypothetical protein VFM05_09260, partial [Candidatus Saccharimonadales bacterium]|nr:hypothetical protein [Candidatus Saccharimonadales bacterium]